MLRNKIGFALLLGTIAAGASAMAFASGPPREFRQTTLPAYGVDICLNWGRNCGRPAADHYCRSMGFRSASRWTVRHDSPSTWVMGDRTVCNTRHWTASRPSHVRAVPAVYSTSR